MKKIVLSVIAFSIIALVNAQTSEERGLEIAKAAEQADLGFGSSTVELKMTLKNKNNQTSERLLATKTLELTEDGDKSLNVFNSPKDVKGTSTLTFTHKVGSDDQWLYLPSIKKYKTRMFIFIVGGLFNLLLALVLVREYQIYGMAYAVTTTEFLLLVMGLFYYKKYSKL